MKNVYTIPENERENVLKLLTRYGKKAAAYGQPLSYEMGEPYATEIKVYKTGYDEANGTHYQEKVGTRMVEAFDLTIDGEIICKEGYTLAAKIEHLEGGNVVYTVADEEGKLEWRNLSPRCEHCGGNHGQIVTFIVRDSAGNEKQVGRTCLKDYCGIDPQRVGLLNKLEDLFLDLDVERYDFINRPAVPAYSTMEALALAIRLQNQYGYTSSSEGDHSNKARLLHLMRDGERPTEKELQEAEAMAAVILAFDQAQAYQNSLDNVWVLLRSGYCKCSHFGYIAYGPLAFDRYKQRLAREAEWEAAKNAERQASDYVGKVGERITVDVADVKLLTSWEGEWGFTFLYKIIDTAGNVLIWYASRTIEEAKKLRATVKDHSERDGIKQTIVTRCSVVAA